MTSIQIGVLTIHLNPYIERDRDFLSGLEYGLLCYWQCDSSTRQAIVADMIENYHSINDESHPETSHPWLVGFVIGWMAGLNNPDLFNEDSPLSLVESLTRKHTACYQDMPILFDISEVIVGDAGAEAANVSPVVEHVG